MTNKGVITKSNKILLVPINYLSTKLIQKMTSN